MHKQLEACPCCGSPLVVTGLTCEHCGTSVTGRFRQCEFCRLTGEQATFLRLFVQRRGNLSEMEKALGISYPTVRNKLEEVIRALQPPDPAAEPNGRDAILQRVAAGEISASEALELLGHMSEEKQ
jgi:hypothetical protein